MKAGILVEHPQFGIGVVMEVQSHGYPLIVKFYQSVNNEIGSKVTAIYDINQNMVYIEARHVKVIG